MAETVAVSSAVLQRLKGVSAATITMQLIKRGIFHSAMVGPRPFRVADYDEEAAQAGVRLRTARAGLTGLLQAYKGIPRPQSDHELEMEYIEKSQSLSPGRLWCYDLGIMLKTVRVLFQAKGL